MVALTLGCTEAGRPPDPAPARANEPESEPDTVTASPKPTPEPETAQPEPAAAVDAPIPAPGRTPAKWTMWRIMEAPDTWLDQTLVLPGCGVELPSLPAVAADGSAVAIGLYSSPVADQRLVTVRIYAAADGKLVRGFTLLGPDEGQLPDDELRRRFCHRVGQLARVLAAGDYAAMKLVGGWRNQVTDGLPARADSWPLILADGATRDVDMAVADIVLAPIEPALAQLELRKGGAEVCRSDADEGQASRVWEGAGLRVWTREPCGC